jgi:hypothetical protein
VQRLVDRIRINPRHRIQKLVPSLRAVSIEQFIDHGLSRALPWRIGFAGFWRLLQVPRWAQRRSVM